MLSHYEFYGKFDNEIEVGSVLIRRIKKDFYLLLLQKRWTILI